MTNTEKIALFRRLFRGREDVYPVRWENKKKRKAGYSPACSNEWVDIVCKKPKVKCGDCPNRRFRQVTDRVVARHLRGEYTIGVYPLLKDETCWFLAVDFDKQSWREDVSAFVETCRQMGLAPAVERSRSGKGAHIWFFFTTPVAARTARQMGCYLITETMTRRHQLGMESYDRLFPNQDTMPKGGFGNLIALPFENEARLKGNTVFVDDSFEPYADQWGYLTSVPRLNASTVEEMAREASHKRLVVGVRVSDTGEVYKEAPWDRPPSGRLKTIRLTRSSTAASAPTRRETSSS